MPPRTSPGGGDGGAGGGASEGGFLVPRSSAANGLLSPATSTATSSVASSILPKPRSQPLRSGGSKETTFINYMDRELMGVTRRFANKSGGGVGDGGYPSLTNGDGMALPLTLGDSRTTPNSKPESGYDSFKQVAKDIDRLIAVLWVSGTPSLQIQYLLTLALLVVSYIPAFPLAPRAMFRILEKLDYAFASLVLGRDIGSGDVLPGFGFGEKRGLSATEKVRVKSLLERTRLVVVEMFEKSGTIEEEEDDDEDDDKEQGEEGDEIDVDDVGGDWGMEMARIYDRTIVELGDTLGETDMSTPVGG